MTGAIKKRAFELGFNDCRITSAAAPARADKLRQWLANGMHGELAWMTRNLEKRADPQLVLSGARSIVTLAVSYAGTHTRESAAIARYARYSDYHDVLREKMKLLATYIDENSGIDARSLWYVDTGPLLERELAERAGIGFVGKHTSLISRKLGNWFFLAEIITTAELETDAAEQNRCGTCTRCISACPTGAITSPFSLDARRCISYLTIELKGAIPMELRGLIGNRIYGCDDCLAVCPWNRFAKEGSLMSGHAREDLQHPELIALLLLDEAAFKAKFAGTPMMRSKRRGLLRNVCVALGNVGDQTTLPALARALSDPEPLVREHAQWAIEQIEKRTKLKAAA